MSDQDVENSSAAPVKVRLLTFDWLPFTDDLSASESLYDAMDSLSADGAFFGNHYLQKSGVSGIVEGFTAGLCDAQPVQGRVLIFGGGATPTLDLRSLPDSLSSEFCGSVSDGLVLPEADFCWLHFESHGTAEETGLEAVLPLLRSLLEPECVVFVTSLAGRAQQSTRFESLLAESLIHAPLWVLGAGAGCCRVQTLTGSHDVGCTIQQLLRRGSCVAGGQSELDNGPIDLVPLCYGPGLNLRRELLIEHEAAKAVRCDDFLLVSCVSSPNTALSERRMALYAKPEDVWNLNDVAGEYHAVVDELIRRLT
jgi:hypothetical protein